jgi:hypothetical protein
MHVRRQKGEATRGHEIRQAGRVRQGEARQAGKHARLERQACRQAVMSGEARPRRRTCGSRPGRHVGRRSEAKPSMQEGDAGPGGQAKPGRGGEDRQAVGATRWGEFRKADRHGDTRRRQAGMSSRKQAGKQVRRGQAGGARRVEARLGQAFSGATLPKRGAKVPRLVMWLWRGLRKFVTPKDSTEKSTLTSRKLLVKLLQA